MLAPYLSPRWCGTHKTCNCSLRPSVKLAQELAACIQTAPPNRRTGTVCNSAAQNCISGTVLADRTPPPELPRNSRSVPASPSRPFVACEVPGDRWPRVARPAAACGPSSRVFLVSRHHDSRGVRTCDPQTPPSGIPGGLQLPRVTQLLLSFHFATYIQSDCYNRPGRPAFPFEVILECCGREQEMGPLCF